MSTDARLAEAGIHTLRIPTPFAVGRVNTYLIEDDPLTLVDSGPNSGRSLDELEQQLVDAGHSIDDIGLILITHQHMDHLGLVDIVAGHSGAEVAALDQLAGFVENYEQAAGRDDEYSARIMLRYGIPEDILEALRSVSRAFRGWGASAKVTRVLHDGDVVELAGRRLEVLWRPGHSPSDTLFWDSERAILMAADHLIKHISSNPLMHRPLDGNEDAPRPQALVTYLDSLRRTRELPAELVLPGHGDPITDHRALIDERLELHRERADRIFDLIAERPRTGYEVAQELWGNVAVTQAFLTLSEVIGHTDILVNEGRVVEDEQDGVVRFVAKSAP